ncbi:adult retina protein [Holotrichia oblita]|uniref:Adult retina protein n=1 Tax=Holotrichia oblita TaxID=644536 RepID=A0ACB9SXC2_HOLOL|nr:adult retina protein [Holotrichia oblita]
MSFNDFMIPNPGKPIGIYDIAKLTADPYLQSFTPKYITSSYSSTGLWPINSMISNDDDFMGSFATDRADFKTKIKEYELPSTSITSNVSFIPSISMSASNVVDFKIDEVTMMIRPMFNDIVNRVRKPKIKIGKSRIYTSTPEKERIQELE